MSCRCWWVVVVLGGWVVVGWVVLSGGGDGCRCAGPIAAWW